MQKRLVWLENNGYLKDKSINNTRTTKFLMPLIGITENSLNNHCLNMFINAYIKSKEELMIFIVLNKLDFPEESEVFILMQNLNENFIRYTDHEEEYILQYIIPTYFKYDYDKVLEGKYSETSKPYKDIITRVYGKNVDEKDHLCYVYETIYPTIIKRQRIADEYLVDISLIKEVSSKPNLDYETYKSIEQLKTEGFGC